MEQYEAIVLKGRGDLDQLELQKFNKVEPKTGEVRVKVLACGVGSTDLTMRKGTYIFAPNYPFVVGYECCGIVDAIGSEVKDFAVGDKVVALLVHGGCSEYLVRPASNFVKVLPSSLDPIQLIPLILNYMTAYQMIHRYAKMIPGQTALVTCASGGVGLALLELLQIHGVKAYAACSEKYFELVKSFDAIPIPDSRSGTPVHKSLLKLLPDGVDASFDCVGGVQVWECVYATKHYGYVIGYGFMGTINKTTGSPSSFQSFRGILGCFTSNLYLRKGSFYGITADYRKNPKPFNEDFQILARLLEEGKIKPIIAEQRFSLLEARKGQELLESGKFTGKIVLSRQ